MKLKFVDVINKDRIIEKLKKFNIDFQCVFLKSDVPCQCRTEIIVNPKNESEYLISIGIFNGQA